jgi:hypothetical protein
MVLQRSLHCIADGAAPKCKSHFLTFKGEKDPKFLFTIIGEIPLKKVIFSAKGYSKAGLSEPNFF